MRPGLYLSAVAAGPQSGKQKTRRSGSTRCSFFLDRSQRQILITVPVLCESFATTAQTSWPNCGCSPKQPREACISGTCMNCNDGNSSLNCHQINPTKTIRRQREVINPRRDTRQKHEIAGHPVPSAHRVNGQPQLLATIFMAAYAHYLGQGIEQTPCTVCAPWERVMGVSMDIRMKSRFSL